MLRVADAGLDKPMLHAAQAAPCNTNDRLVDLATGCIAPARPTNSSTRPRTAAVAIIIVELAREGKLEGLSV